MAKEIDFEDFAIMMAEQSDSVFTELGYDDAIEEICQDFLWQD